MVKRCLPLMLYPVPSIPMEEWNKYQPIYHLNRDSNMREMVLGVIIVCHNAMKSSVHWLYHDTVLTIGGTPLCPCGIISKDTPCTNKSFNKQRETKQQRKKGDRSEQQHHNDIRIAIQKRCKDQSNGKPYHGKIAVQL